MKTSFLRLYTSLLVATAMLFLTPPLFAIDWSGYDWIATAGGCESYQNAYKVVAGTPGPTNIDNIQNPGWGTAPGLYVTFPSADFRSISLPSSEYDIQGAGILFHMSAFTAKETVVTVNEAGTERSFTVYYKDGYSSIFDSITSTGQIKNLKIEDTK